MTKFDVHTVDTAPAESKGLLRKSQQLYGGMIPNLHGVMAESPALLEAYQVLNEIAGKTSFGNDELNVIWLTVNYENECHYCMAAHTVVARHSGLPEEDIEALRNGEPLSDPKKQALRRFTAHMVDARGWAEPAEVEAFFAAGYSRSQLLDVVLGIGMKTLSNYTNHIADTPVDPPFEAFEWSPPASGKAQLTR